LTFFASAISTCQPAGSSWSCTKRAPFIDSIAARIAVTVEPSRQSVQAIGIRRRRIDFDRRTLGVEQMKVEALATEIQTGVQH
jgi:hypothetical protein